MHAGMQPFGVENLISQYCSIARGTAGQPAASSSTYMRTFTHPVQAPTLLTLPTQPSRAAAVHVSSGVPQLASELSPCAQTATSRSFAKRKDYVWAKLLQFHTTTPF